MSVSAPAHPGRGTPARPGMPGPRARPAADACPLCGTPLLAEQDWCLRCGAAARTRLAAAPNWRLPVAVVAVVGALALGLLAVALVKLAGGSSSSSRPGAAALRVTPTTQTGAAAAPGASPGGTSTSPAAPGAAAGAPGARSSAPAAGATRSVPAPSGGTAAPPAPRSTPNATSPTTTAPPAARTVLPRAATPGARPTRPSRAELEQLRKLLGGKR